MATKIRPRIKLISKLSTEEVENKIANYLESSENLCKGWVRDGHAIICAEGKESHLWTPQLNLQIDDVETGTELRGVIGPGPSVWTGFIFAFSILGFLTFVVLMWGLINMSLGNDSSVLWLVPVLLLLIGGIYGMARFGQSLSKKQVLQLNDFVYKELN